MSHYTFLSGTPTDTVTLVCPHCRQPRRFDEDRWWDLQRAEYVRARFLYCSEACRKIHTTQLALDIAHVFPLFAEVHHSSLAMVMDGVIPAGLARRLAG